MLVEGAAVDLQGPDVLVDLAAQVAGHLLSVKVGPHVVLYVVLSPHHFPAFDTLVGWSLGRYKLGDQLVRIVVVVTA